LSFQIFAMPPAVVFQESDWEIQAFDRREMIEDRPVASGGENWDEELLVPAQGRLLYVGQGESHYTYFHQQIPGMVYPKRRKKKKKKKKKKGSSSPQPPPPTPASEPAPIDWSDWEELCQTSPPPPPAPSPLEDWDAEIAASQDKEDWDAEIAASQ
jgi:hypothetical protein